MSAPFPNKNYTRRLERNPCPTGGPNQPHTDKHSGPNSHCYPPGPSVLSTTFHLVLSVFSRINQAFLVYILSITIGPLLRGAQGVQSTALVYFLFLLWPVPIATQCLGTAAAGNSAIPVVSPSPSGTLPALLPVRWPWGETL